MRIGTKSSPAYATRPAMPSSFSPRGESACKIFLVGEDAVDGDVTAVHRVVGLGDMQLGLVANAHQKRRERPSSNAVLSWLLSGGV